MASVSSIRLFSTDLDGTLLGNPEATLRFNEAWNSLSTQKKEKKPLLVYNTGRSVRDVINLITEEKLLPHPDYIIGGVGTEIFDYRNQKQMDEFYPLLKKGWNLRKIEDIISSFPGTERQPEELLNDYKSSWYLNRAEAETLTDIQSKLKEAGLNISLVYSSQRDLDILPKHANKGNALLWLCQQLYVATNTVLVAGDTGNDSSMFMVNGIRGIVVENAQPELFEATVKLPVFAAKSIFADGVLEGLEHFKVIGTLPTVSAGGSSAETTVDPEFKMLFDSSSFESLRAGDRKLISEGYVKAIETLEKNITPIGFSACSLMENEVTGTDANYRSVWARDGAITLISSIMVDKPHIRKAQEQTLRTLFDHISPNGQLPSNVNIDTGKPDYSGVGGICSIDSGLWAIIAFYHYVRETKDLDFLEEYEKRLQRAMDWLSAHDSNNDGLLEIPEAGDWTDLFGRSYNVLYDEVLWYRTNVCYGRLLEMRSEFDRAADYLRWSQHIRGELLTRFWPSTAPSEDSAQFSFADQQFQVGDTQYLLAQISPFSFSWRCDVYANLLAFLTNVLDIERAKTAFKFMWGVGVNKPWPVKNLYPAVQAGDPDWRPYYIVNLLNLPDHYHNGGIWPFIGGLWVRFIHRLGLSDIAAHELVRLAELNERGIQAPWEFNEWMHGQTGRAMGKRYQAWSAASYIRACHEIQMSPENGDSD